MWDKYGRQKSFTHHGVVDLWSNEKSAENVGDRGVSDTSETFTPDVSACQAPHGQQSATESEDIYKDESLLEAEILQISELQFRGLQGKFVVSIFPSGGYWVADLLTECLPTWVVLLVDIALDELLFEWGPLAADGLDGLAKAECLSLGDWLYYGDLGG